MTPEGEASKGRGRRSAPYRVGSRKSGNAKHLTNLGGVIREQAEDLATTAHGGRVNASQVTLGTLGRMLIDSIGTDLDSATRKVFREYQRLILLDEGSSRNGDLTAGTRVPMKSVLARRSRSGSVEPGREVGNGRLLPVNHSTMASVNEDGVGEADNVFMASGPIQAIEDKYEEHSQGAYGVDKCWPSHSVDGPHVLNFASGWYFETNPPRKSDSQFWVVQKLFRTQIMFCPEGVEKMRFQTVFHEAFQMRGTRTLAVDIHTDAMPFGCSKDNPAEWCAEKCFEMGYLGLASSPPASTQAHFVRLADTTYQVSSDGGKTWSDERAIDDPNFQRSPEYDIPPLRHVPGYGSAYILKYEIQHCSEVPVGGLVSIADPQDQEVEVPGAMTPVGELVSSETRRRITGELGSVTGSSPPAVPEQRDIR